MTPIASIVVYTLLSSLVSELVTYYLVYSLPLYKSLLSKYVRCRNLHDKLSKQFEETKGKEELGEKGRKKKEVKVNVAKDEVDEVSSKIQQVKSRCTIINGILNLAFYKYMSGKYYGEHVTLGPFECWGPIVGGACRRGIDASLYSSDSGNVITSIPKNAVGWFLIYLLTKSSVYPVISKISGAVRGDIYEGGGGDIMKSGKFKKMAKAWGVDDEVLDGFSGL